MAPCTFLVFDQPGLVTFQRMEGELVDVVANVDQDTLSGRLADRPVTITLARDSLDGFTLRNRGLHWVQEAPYFG